MISVLLLAALAARGLGLGKEEIVYIETRDGAKLKTHIWYPDESLFEKPWATIYEKSPYNVDDLEEPSKDFYTNIGYAYMGQAVRGLQGSTGTYSFFRTSGNDTIDTIRWWLNNAVGNWTNGLFATSGISADCLSQYADVIGVTQSGYWPNGNYEPFMYDFNQILTGAFALGNGLGHKTIYQGGAYREGLITGWLDDLGEGSTVQTIWENEAFTPYWYDLDGDWQNQWNIMHQSLVNFAGWFDIFGGFQIQTIIDVNQTADVGAKGQQLLIVDPGGHCPMGGIIWEGDLFGWEYMILEVIPQVFESRFAAAKLNATFNIHEIVDWNVMFYTMGSNDVNGSFEDKNNFWVRGESFPPIIRTDEWFLGEEDKLLPSTPGISGSKSYVYNPFDPVTTWGGANLILQPCGPTDQVVVDFGRKDVLHFTSEVFEDYYAAVGPFFLDLYVGSNAPDTDFTAKVIDVYPDGRAMLVQDSIVRMRWRDMINNPYATEPSDAMESTKIYNVTISFGHMAWIWNPGHSLRVSISSSNHKRFSVNYNSGGMMVDGDKGARNATNTVHFGTINPSKLRLPVVDLQWMLERKVDPIIEPVKDMTNGRVSRETVRKMRDTYYRRQQN